VSFSLHEFLVPLYRGAMLDAIPELRGLRVRVDKVVYMPDLEAPADRPHPFVYYLTIENGSAEAVTIKGRKWVVTDAEGRAIVVEGEGVVGKFPHLRPGQRFSYNSFHVVAADSVAEGSFIGVCDDGSPVLTRIPKFRMDIPG
jgi:ApaG protein